MTTSFGEKEFNPPENRLEVLEHCGILSYIKSTVFGGIAEDEQDGKRKEKRMKQNRDDDVSDCQSSMSKWAYCDLGCNEGDLSLALSRAIAHTKDSRGTLNYVHCLGLDIDKELIDRARSKIESYCNSHETKKGQVSPQIKAEFHECNLNDSKDHLEKSKLFLQQNSIDRFNLTSIFSTTMWIHIHSGDEGLVAFLERACSITNYLLIEPQPSKCYRSVNIRLRRMNRPEEDISVERLKMRADIENEIDRVMQGFGFERVAISRESRCIASSNDDSRTKWKRNLQLYKRINEQ